MGVKKQEGGQRLSVWNSPLLPLFSHVRLRYRINVSLPLGFFPTNNRDVSSVWIGVKGVFA